MITLTNVTLRRGPHVLLQEVNWTIYHKQRIGIIGANGCGKTSLFNMLLKNIQPDLGDMQFPRQLRMSHVAQETPGYTKSALDFVLDGDTELRAIEAEILDAEHHNQGERIGELYGKLGDIDGYTAPARAAQLLAGLGFSEAEQQKSVSGFSGGWRVRLNLAKALMCRSDILLLDEPTNHLDLDAVIWLEQWLSEYQGTLLLISHDRDFLDKTVDHIAHISHQRLKVYSGNYSGFETLHANELMLQQSAFEKQQKKVDHLMSFVNRFKAKASKAKQAQSRMKAIERMDLVCAVQSESAFQFEFKKPDRCPMPLLTSDHAEIAYGDHIVLRNVNLSITPKDRIAVLGPNGAGKSSFIKMLAAELAPTKGERTPSAGLKIGYFAQHQVDHLNLTESPLEHMREISGNTSELELRKYLGGFDFTGDRVYEPVGNFSGGEKSRLALAMIVWKKPNLLLLDEPTNHLDLEMRNALSIALQEYEGAMILVSHDRFLVRSTTDQLMLVANGKLEEFSGDLNDYQKWLMDFRKEQAKAASNTPKVVAELVQPVRSNRNLLQKIEKLEKEIAKLEKQEAVISAELAEASLYEPANKDKLAVKLQDQQKIKKELERVEQEWLQACEERDKS